MEKEQYTRLRHHLVKICELVDPLQVLPYLKCLTRPDMEKIRCENNNHGPYIAARGLVDALFRRTDSYEQFMHALMEGGHEKLVSEIDQRYYQRHMAERRPQSCQASSGGDDVLLTTQPVGSDGPRININNPGNVTVQIGGNNDQHINGPPETGEEVMMIERRGEEENVMIERRDDGDGTGEGNGDREQFDQRHNTMPTYVGNDLGSNSLHSAPNHQKRGSSDLNNDSLNIPLVKNTEHGMGTEDIAHVYQQARSMSSEEKLSNPVEETGRPELTEPSSPYEESTHDGEETGIKVVDVEEMTGNIDQSPEKSGVNSTVQTKSIETGYNTEGDSLQDETLLKSVALQKERDSLQDETLLKSPALQAKGDGLQDETLLKAAASVNPDVLGVDIRDTTKVTITAIRPSETDDSITVAKRKIKSSTAEQTSDPITPRIRISRMEEQERSIPKLAEISLHVEKGNNTNDKTPNSGESIESNPSRPIRKAENQDTPLSPDQTDLKKNVSSSSSKKQTEAPINGEERMASYSTDFDDDNDCKKEGKDHVMITDSSPHIQKAENKNTSSSLGNVSSSSSAKAGEASVGAGEDICTKEVKGHVVTGSSQHVMKDTLSSSDHTDIKKNVPLSPSVRKTASGENVCTKEEKGHVTTESDEESLLLSVDSSTASESSDTEAEQHIGKNVSESNNSRKVVHEVKSEEREVVFDGSSSQVVAPGTVRERAGEIRFQTDCPEVDNQRGVELARQGGQGDSSEGQTHGTDNPIVDNQSGVEFARQGGQGDSSEGQTHGNVVRSRKQQGLTMQGNSDGLVEKDPVRWETGSKSFTEQGYLRKGSSSKETLPVSENIGDRQTNASENRAREIVIAIVFLLIGIVFTLIFK